MQIDLDEREFSTVLAALRYWQRKGWSDPDNKSELEIAEESQSEEAMVPHEIDDLCERINCERVNAKA